MTRGSANLPDGRAGALEGIQAALLGTGSVEEAHRYGRRALAAYRGLGAEDDAARVARRLSDPEAATG
ncbi:hypothetical protein CAG99_17925 [Streptomyces marincola]|uniref:Uncharacterized protein n=1 Tax=Streptomyces marincola TaxID=2878388 RepID=A0A1W7D1N4_9ACTN|nr:hypothetical protein CAG99_17925 [Streptomyces marincola]